VEEEAEEEEEEEEEWYHHLMVRFWREARSIQGAMLASWSSGERMSSSPGEKSRAYERLRKSWVVDEPRTISLGLALT